MTDADKNCPHCGVHIDEHPASYCLNAWVAADVMELAIAYSSDEACFVTPIGIPTKDYSGDIAAAWEVVEKLNQSGYIVEIINDCVAWSVVFRNIDTNEKFTSDWKTSLEVQVCRAAIKAMPKSQDRSPLNIADALEKYAKALDKTRDELDDTEKMQAIVNAVLAQGEKQMTESLSYKMYAEDTIRLIKATLEGTTTPMVTFKVDPLEFCREAHKVKDELISNALSLLENTIDARFNNWIGVDAAMPLEDAFYLVYSPSANPEKPFIGKARFNPDNDLGWSFDIIKTWLASAITHWMPLPKPPEQIVVNGACAGCGLPLDGDHAPWCRTLEENK